MAAPELPPLLTPRQLEVLELMAKGLTNAEIAGVLGISPGTAKVHVSRIIAALDVTNRTEAAMALQALRTGEAPSGAPVPGFGDRPAIAVLPFDNLSPDPEQSYFADALVEDLTTELARWRWFPVIARNTSFTYRDRPKDMVQVCRELGARYLIEGSSRRAGERVRINVQLIDGERGQHVFAEKYDRSCDDVFALQDEIVESIVGALEPAVLRVEGLRALRKPVASLGAWERFQRGMTLLHRQSADYAAQARALFEAAIEDDETFAAAHAGLSMACFASGLSGIGGTHESGDSEVGLDASLQAALAWFQRAEEAGRRGVALDPLDPAGHIGLGAGLGMRGDFEGARGCFERAVELNPSSAIGAFSLANALVATERAEAALTLYERAIRLSPRDPQLHHFEGALAGTHFLAGRDAEALDHLRRSLDVEPPTAMSYLPMMPACLAHLGRIEEAKAQIERVYARWPQWNLGLVRLLGGPPMVERIAAGYRLAGHDLDD